MSFNQDTFNIFGSIDPITPSGLFPPPKSSQQRSQSMSMQGLSLNHIDPLQQQQQQQQQQKYYLQLQQLQMQQNSQFSQLNSDPFMPMGASAATGDDLFPSPHSSISSASKESMINPNQSPTNAYNNTSSSNFTLPSELQGGINNFFNRRPSFAADLVTNSPLDPMLQYQLGLNHRGSIFETQNSLRNNSVDYPSLNQMQNRSALRSNSDFDPNYVQLDDGLLLNKTTNTIVTSPDLKRQFSNCCNYFGDFDAAMKVVDQLNALIGLPTVGNTDNIFSTTTAPLPVLQQRVNKLLEHLLHQNEDLKSSNHLTNKNYSLILNKNGRLDIISFPKTSNLQPTPRDLIIIEGDRGKDLVMILKPVIEFKFALFFNYLKKKLHLKSLEFGNSSSESASQQSSSGNNHHNSHRHHNNHHGSNNGNNNNNKSIINEDENFITLPNKQILRFAKPHELNQLISKYNDEIMAYRICLNYAASLNLSLIIKNVEFQFDKKKLIIYYYCLQRLDFRGLIKELFKIYKTRIWLCAILPLEKTNTPLLEYELEKRGKINRKGDEDTSYRSNVHVVHDSLPTTDQIYQFSEVNEPIYFHCKIFSNLIEMFKYEISNLDVFSERYGFLNNA